MSATTASVFDRIRAGAAEPCRPWPRYVLPVPDWAAMAAALAFDRAALLGLWADSAQVHALLRAGNEVAAVSVAVAGGRYPALSVARPAAALFERMIGDLWGHVAEGGRDDRHWLDHGRWPLAHPLSPRPGLPGGTVAPPEFITPEAAGLMQIPLGPIRGPTHAAIEEPAHLRLTTRAATVLHAEARLGYAHKGTLALMRGKSPRAAARFVARLGAEATVAHSMAFAHAAEAALDVEAPPRAVALRMVMAEQERMAGHLDDLGRVADAAGFAPLHAVAGRLREVLVRAAERAFGHRLMMDVVVPGGVAADIAPDGEASLLAGLDAVAAALPGLRRRWDRLLARLEGVGVIAGGSAGNGRAGDGRAGGGRAGGGSWRHGSDVGEAGVYRRQAAGAVGQDPGAGGEAWLPGAAGGADWHADVGGAGVGSVDVGGVVGRAGGRGFDARMLHHGYVELGLTPPVEHGGDAAARCRIRLAEIADSLGLLRRMLGSLPAGAVSVALPTASGEGIGCAESLRGGVWHWLRLDHGQIAAIFPCDPGWALWPLAEAAMAGGPVEEVAMTRLSCGLPASAIDL